MLLVAAFSCHYFIQAVDDYKEIPEEREKKAGSY